MFASAREEERVPVRVEGTIMAKGEREMRREKRDKEKRGKRERVRGGGGEEEGRESQLGQSDRDESGIGEG